MALINRDILEHYMREFGRMIEERDGTAFTSFPGSHCFRAGEGYKQDLLDNARVVLATHTWSDAPLDGSGVIGERVYEVIRSNDFNLIHYMQKDRFYDALRDKPAVVDQVLYEIFCGMDDRAAFESAVRTFGGRYDLISSLFFLKDGSRYLPARSRMFEERFAMLGIDFKMEARCSWDNYCEYLRLMSEIQLSLNSFFDFEVPATLLDAHSFVWMLEDVEECASGIPGEHLPKNVEATTMRRIGQEQFRQGALEYWGHACAVTGCADERLLVASHIKPWRDCDEDGPDREWLDPYNGIALTPSLDLLFDQGMISFADDGAIVFSPELRTDDAACLGVTSDMRLTKVDKRHLPYLAYHREHVLLG